MSGRWYEKACSYIDSTAKAVCLRPVRPSSMRWSCSSRRILQPDLFGSMPAEC